jgi:hypothetical protein
MNIERYLKLFVLAEHSHFNYVHNFKNIHISMMFTTAVY